MRWTCSRDDPHTTAGIILIWLSLFGTIIFLSFLPETSPVSADISIVLGEDWDLYHILAYSVFSFFTFMLLYACFSNLKQLFIYLYGSVLVMVIGLAIEIIQQYVGRSYSLGDLTLDAVGVVIALLAYRFFEKNLVAHD